MFFAQLDIDLILAALVFLSSKNSFMSLQLFLVNTYKSITLIAFDILRVFRRLMT